MNEKITSEELQSIAFNIIVHSGEARTKIHTAFQSMQNAAFDEAKNCLEAANESILNAHQDQTKLLQSYANGQKIEMEIIMVHAQDHLMTTMTLLEVAQQMLYLYKQNHALKKSCLADNDKS